jgi:beta-mannosidase
MVWAGAGDIELYNSYIGRFVSEYGMQGMLPMTSIRQFSTEADWDTTSFVMRLHERHIAGWPTLNHYMAKYF